MILILGSVYDDVLYFDTQLKKRREEDRDIYGDGFKQTTRVAKTEKAYSRKGKNKFKGNFFNDEY